MQKRKGISLIVLVITIIVMIVLAGAIILSLNNAGIIEKSNQAVSSTDEATVKELAQMAWAEAYASGVRSVEDTYVNDKKVEGLKTKVETALRNNDINKKGNIQYLVNVTEKGVTIKPIEEAWVMNQKELKVQRGTEELTIGQDFNYDEGAAYDGGWKVLGADTDGNLLIMSDKDVAQVTLGGADIDVAHKSWQTGVSDITKAAQDAIPLKTAPNAISVRSIEVEDIDKVTGYDKKTHRDSTVPNQYGNTVAYTYNGTTYPTYTGTNGATNNLTTDHKDNGFYWSGGKNLHHTKSSDLTNANNAVKEDKTIIDSNSNAKAIITSNFYGYYPTTLTTESIGEIKGIETTTAAYKMLFRDSKDTANVTYWLASAYVNADTDFVDFGVRYVRNGLVSGRYLFASSGSARTPSGGVRAVVILQSNVDISDLK